MRKIAGIDPGNSGGIAIAYDTNIIGACPMPTHEVTPVKKTYTYVNFSVVYNFLKENNVEAVYIELVGARPGQGSVSMYNFGYSTGGLHGVCASLGVEVITVRPQVWKAALFNDDSEKDKEAAIEFCKFNFPNISLLPTKRSKVPSDGIADAICIATYGLQQEKLKDKNINKE
jgi:crossover junction endodeoxyribonuclease RuvC